MHAREMMPAYNYLLFTWNKFLRNSSCQFYKADLPSRAKNQSCLLPKTAIPKFPLSAKLSKSESESLQHKSGEVGKRNMNECKNI